jgi:hypothetical protein
MGIGILDQMAFGNLNDLTTPTSIRQYRLGQKIATWNPQYNAIQVYKYIYASTNLIQYQPYVISISAIVGQEILTAAPFTIAAPGMLIGVPQIAITSGYYGFVQIEGDGSVLMTAQTYVVGDMLQLLNTGTALVVDGTSGSTTFAPTTCAISKATGNTAIARPCFFYGQPSVIAAS